VRRHDPDRYFAALFAPEHPRRFLFALYALNVELARVGETVREAMLADIRLAWWRETVEEARAGKPRSHAVARALAEVFAAVALPPEFFTRMIAARTFDAGPERFADLAALEEYAAATAGTLMQLAARALGEPVDEAALQAGVAVALCGILRSLKFHAARGKLYLPDDLLREVRLLPEEVLAGRGGAKLAAVKARLAARAREYLSKARAMTRPQASLPAFLPAALVPLYLKRDDPPLWRRQLALLVAAWRGRI